MNLLLLSLLACGGGKGAAPPPLQPIPEKDSPGLLSKQLDAYVTHVCVDIARADGVIQDSERRLIFAENANGFDPISFHAMNDEEGLRILSATKAKMHSHATSRKLDLAISEWSFVEIYRQFMEKVAESDGDVSQDERKRINWRISALHSIKPDGTRRDDAATKRWETEVLRAEAPLILDSIRNAERQHKEKEGRYVGFELQPPRQSDAALRRWQPTGKDGDPVLPIELHHKVRGSYWVQAEAEGFKAYGIIDADGDGVFSTYLATSAANATRITSDEIY